MEKEFNVTEWLDNIINKGIQLDSSDIHFEPFDNFIKIRYRIDGILLNESKLEFKKNIISAINVRIKIIADMDIAEKRKPQDGKISNYIYNDNKYDIRVSSICTIYGEKFVMRIMPKNLDIKNFKSLGFNNNNIKLIESILNNKNGIIYLGGATGSGKTTTLYSIINYLNNSERNIYTIENPVEKTIENINQIEINPLAGIDYISSLKALLRQDPDIIVIGEIRDVETAKLALRASLTGHLVITTLHSNNAIDSINRLLDMNIEPYLLSACSLGFISQKLIRTLCSNCKQKIEYENLKNYEKLWIKKILNQNDIDETIVYNKNFYIPIGCDECFNGYKGRTSISEILKTNDDIKNNICSNDFSKNEKIKEFIPLSLDGLYKSFHGITSIDELIKQLN